MPLEDPNAGVPDEWWLKPFRNEGKVHKVRPYVPLWHKLVGGIGGIVLVVLIMLFIAFLIYLTTQKGGPF